ncbi:MAG: glycoside hydrolase [Bacteroidetes bacterium GWF2_40_14]|nr:MAG: glycoside hydrolase [Bacteroidetes bacterium GWF2_40_14]
MQKIFCTVILLSILTLICGQEKNYNTAGAGNPLLPGYFADPTIRKFGGTYYLYSTTDGTAGGLGPSQVWISKDFVNWTIMPMNWPTTRQIWAPDVMQGPDGRYYFYYCQACMVYCAISDSPLGPWVNILGENEAVLIPDRFVPGAITLDPQSFLDDDGSVYLFWGTWGIYKNFGCGAGKLEKDMKSFEKKILIPNTQITDFFEAPFVFKRNGIYYLTYSSGSCHDHTYRIQYATSTESPLGPYKFASNNPILETSDDGTIHGPGHHSILKEGNDYYIIYHCHNIPFSTRGFNRQICADKLEFDKDGNILKVKAGHNGVGYLAIDSNPFKNIVFGRKITASSSYNSDFRPEYAIDDNNATLWRASSCKSGEWLTIDLGKRSDICRIWTQFEYATSFYQYKYEVSDNGRNWKVFADRSTNTISGSPMIDHGNVRARYLRLTVTGNEKNGLFPAIWNIKVFSDGKDPFSSNNARFNGQSIAAVPERRGLLIEIDAEEYELGTRPDILRNKAHQNIKSDNQFFKALFEGAMIENIQGKKAFAFDTLNIYRSNFGLPPTMKANAPYTVIAWVYSSSPRKNEYFIDINDAQGELEKIIVGYGTCERSGITMHHGWFEDIGVKELSGDTEWKHIAVTFDGYIEKVYINGQQVAEKNIFLNIVQSQNITLGAKSTGEFPFRGKLHSLKFYDTPLEFSAIANDFLKTK